MSQVSNDSASNPPHSHTSSSMLPSTNAAFPTFAMVPSSTSSPTPAPLVFPLPATAPALGSLASASPSNAVAFSPTTPFSFAPLAPAARAVPLSSPASPLPFAPFSFSPPPSQSGLPAPASLFSFVGLRDSPNPTPNPSPNPNPNPPSSAPPGGVSLAAPLPPVASQSSPAPPSSGTTPPTAVDPSVPLRPLIYRPTLTPPTTCAEVLKHAALDNTHIYLALLPAAIRAEVDRWAVPWRCAGELRQIYASDKMVCFLDHVSYKGKEIVIVQSGGGRSNREPESVILRLPREPSQLRLLPAVRFPGRLLRTIVTPDEEPLLLFEHSLSYLKLYDMDGGELHSWVAPSGEISDNHFWFRTTEHCQGWIRYGFRFSNARHPEVVYNLPHLLASAFERPMAWEVYGNDGEPKLILSGRDAATGRSRVDVCDLRTGVRDYRRLFLDSGGHRSFTVAAHLGALVYHTLRPHLTEIYPLANGECAPLIKETTSSSFHATSTIVIFKATPAHVAANRIVYWTPQLPCRLCSIEFGDWQIVHQIAELVIARKGEDHLFWNLSLGCGVRSDLNVCSSPDVIVTRTEVYSYGNAYFVRPNDGTANLYLIPLVGADRPPPTLPERVPATIPYAKSRLVYTSADTSIPLSDVRSCTVDTAFPAPVFHRAHEVWGFH